MKMKPEISSKFDTINPTMGLHVTENKASNLNCFEDIEAKSG
jgi:hypothetical protein